MSFITEVQRNPKQKGRDTKFGPEKEAGPHFLAKGGESQIGTKQKRKSKRKNVPLAPTTPHHPPPQDLGGGH